MNKKQAALIILDGWGYREDVLHNAVAAAKTPNFDRLWQKYPHTLVEASGLAVGLPEGQMGNSEIGHTTIGAGRAIPTDLVRIEQSIRSGKYAEIEAFKGLLGHVSGHNSSLHVMGLLSDGGVHSHIDHLLAFLSVIKSAVTGDGKLKKVFIHVFTDGRDTAPQNAAGYVKKLEDFILENNLGEIVKIASVSGRFYAMDRDNNADRIEKAWNAINGKADLENGGVILDLNKQKVSEYISELYKADKKDEHLIPFVTSDAVGEIAKNDGIFFYNFRADRARQMTAKILEYIKAKNWFLVTQTLYGDNFKEVHVAFPSIEIKTTLAGEIARAGLTQAHIAETEKFPHATYFLNGGKENPHDGEKHIMLHSRKDVPTHDLAPKMKAREIADAAIAEINAGTDFIFINIANPDMVGHTANVPAIIEALEETDEQLGRVIDVLSAKGGVAFVTADHGNAEMNFDVETGEKHTAHTINPVPVIVTAENLGEKVVALRDGGTLADIAPTILDIMGIEKSADSEMEGKSLIV